MATKQKDAVFAALMLAAENGLEGDAQTSFAVEQVKAGLMAGEISHSDGSISDPKKAESYAKSLISNWRKKDKRLNGDVPYVPATRRGPQVKDERLKALNESLKSLRINDPTNTDLIARVEGAIEARKAELMTEKASSKVQSLEETHAALAALGIEVAS